MKDHSKMTTTFVYEPGFSREGGLELSWLSEKKSQCTLKFTYQSRSGGKK